jgi:hypothetical protein
MLILDTVNRKLQVALAGVVTATELPWVASYVDVAAPDVYAPGCAHGVTAGVADVDIVPAPAAGKVRQVKYLGIYNKDSAAADVTVKLDDAATERELVRITLAAKSTLVYTDGEGWRVINTAGQIL